MNSLPDFKKYAKEYLLSEEFYIFALSNCNRYTQMSLRHILLCILMLSVIAPARGQSSAGSSIVSRTVLSGDGLKAAEHRVYDNGLGDVIQEVQSWPGSSLPSLAVRHDYDDYRRKTRSWPPVTSSGSVRLSRSTATVPPSRARSTTVSSRHSPPNSIRPVPIGSLTARRYP